MARYTGPSTRVSRRFGQYIVGSPKVLERRNFPPGQHGPKSRRKLSEYAVGLNEKQKLRFIYGLLEPRLDSVVYLLGFAKSRAAARQLVNHGHVRVNGHKVDIASYNVVQGDEVEIKAVNSSRQLATRAIEENRARVVPGWLTRNDEALKGTVTRLPTRDEMEPSINEQLIVEYYSRF